MSKEREAWDRFLASGKVEDYLACVRNQERNEENDLQMKDGDERAGFCGSDRNGAYGI